ncbi:Inner membrane protein YrbG [Myxococcaceae bacterium]|nr:Inner membrane protein YrbG [Myxococcaceae bacterium]
MAATDPPIEARLGIETFGIFALGLVMLTAGAELLIRGAVRIARAAGISPLVVGLTIVAAGTSAPELAVSLGASLSGQADIAVGNVVGSNIFNVLFILGACALLSPLVVEQKLVRRDVPLMVAVSVALLALAWNGTLGRVEGFVLLAAFCGYIVFVVRQSRRESRAVAAEYEREFGPRSSDPPRPGRLVADVVLVLAGLAVLVLGARMLVDSSVEIARSFGLSELVIGLTLVAAGTSLPEVATSIIATLRGERDIAVGNVVGSNLFNVLGILALTALVTPGGVAVAPAVLRVDLPVMVAVAVACLPIFFSSHRINRWEGGLFLAYYVIYTTWIALHATLHDALPAFSSFVVSIALPLTAVTLAVLSWRAIAEQRRAGAEAATKDAPRSE